MADFKKLIDGILALRTEEELLSVFSAAREKLSDIRTAAAMAARVNIRVADRVSWQSKKQRRRATGIVKKVNYTRAEVTDDVTGVVWVIPLSMLTKEVKHE